MIGAVIGDIVGSRFEFDNRKTKDFELFTQACFFTDDSVMSFAVAEALLESNGDWEQLPELTVKQMKRLGQIYPHAGYGGRFRHWLHSESTHPYNSFGNGSAMRVSPCGFAARSLEEAKHLSYNASCVTHNHYEGIKGAEAVAVAIYLARTGAGKDEIRAWIEQQYYPLNFTLDEIRASYRFNETCQGSVPQAIEAFLESEDFEDCIRCAISIGGDSDTVAAMACSIAEAFYGVPAGIRTQAEKYLSEELLDILRRFEAHFEV